MKYLPVLVIVCFLTSCATVQKVTAVKDKSGNLVGVANKNTFMQTPYQKWFVSNYENYTVDQSAIPELTKHLKGIIIKGFMGTWCGDSKRETPRFYKILEAASFNLKNFELITVNRSKKTPDNLQQGLNIIRVPTFIFYKNGKEIGRYVEYARTSLEKDMLAILSGKEYKHSYEK